MTIRAAAVAVALVLAAAGCAAPTAGAPTAAASQTAPSSLGSPSATPVPTTVALIPKGPLLWQAALDPRGSDIDLASQYVIGDAAAATIRPVAGGIEVVIRRTGGPTGVSFRRTIPASFVAEMDLRVEPGSDMQFVWRVRSGDQLHLLKLDTAREAVELIYVDPADWPSRLQPIGPRLPIPRLLSGRVVTLGVVAEAPRYTLFVDGARAAEVEDPRLTPRSLPLAFGAFGEHGVTTILGVRVYALPGR